MEKQLVNDYYIESNSITAMANNESLFNSCLSKRPKLTKKDFRQNLDTAQRIIKEYQESESKKNLATGPKSEKVDHPPCDTCGCTVFIKTGVCHTCSNCASSTSCS